MFRWPPDSRDSNSNCVPINVSTFVDQSKTQRKVVLLNWYIYSNNANVYMMIMSRWCRMVAHSMFADTFLDDNLSNKKCPGGEVRTQRGYVLEASLRILILGHKASEEGQALRQLRKPIGKLFVVYKGFAKLLLEFHSLPWQQPACDLVIISGRYL